MSTTETPVSIPNPEELQALCSAMLGQVNDLVQRLAAFLPPDRVNEMDQIMQGGGRIGLEITIDATYMPQFALIGTELEGTHRVFHTIRPVRPAETH